MSDTFLQESNPVFRAKYPALFKGAEEALAKRLRQHGRGPAQTSDSSKPSTSSTAEGTSSSSSSNQKKTRPRPTSLLPPDLLANSKLSLLDKDGGCGGWEATPLLGKRKVNAIKKKLREATKGPKWFGMTAPEMTDDRKNDLEALKLRGALDTKRFYKRNNLPMKPKYFQVGKVVENKADFYNSRLTKKQRKRTIAEELMSEFNS